MMRKNFVLLLLVFCSFTVLGQVFTQATARRNSLDNLANSLAFANDSLGTTSTVKGSQYFNPSFTIGDVFRDDHRFRENVALRYNAFKDEMESKSTAQNQADPIIFVQKGPGIAVRMGRTYFISLLDPDTFEYKFYQILHASQKNSLFKLNTKTFKAAKRAESGMTPDIPAIYKDKPIYYIMDKEGVMFQLPSSKKKFLDTFGDDSDAIKAYMKKAKKKHNLDTHLIDIIKHYNSLK